MCDSKQQNLIFVLPIKPFGSGQIVTFSLKVVQAVLARFVILIFDIQMIRFVIFGVQSVQRKRGQDFHSSRTNTTIRPKQLLKKELLTKEERMKERNTEEKKQTNERRKREKKETKKKERNQVTFKRAPSGFFSNTYSTAKEIKTKFF